MGKVANNFQRNFSRILEDVVFLTNKNISENLIESGEFVTKNTLTAEKMSSNLSGIDIDTNITLKELNLTSGNSNPNEQLINNISRINRKTLELLGKLIQFKKEILNQVLSCKLFTANYPLLIAHIINEAKMYYKLLSKIESKENFSKDYLYEQEIFGII